MVKKLSALVLALLMVCALAGCASKDKAVRETIDGFCTAMQKMDLETMGTYIADDSQTISTDTDSELEKMIYAQLAKWDEEMTYTIDEISVDGSKATAKITCNYVDASPVFIETVNEYKEQMGSLLTGGGGSVEGKKTAVEIYEEILQSKIDTVETSTASQKISLSLTRKDGVWKIDTFPKEAANVLICNFMEAYGSN